MTTPLINITADGLFVDGAEVAFPIQVSVLTDLWGPPDRWENKGNVILIWHDLGVYAHAVGDEHISSICLQLLSDPDGPRFQPTSTFSGTLQIDGAPAESRLPSVKKTRAAQRRADPTVAHAVKLHLYGYGFYPHFHGEDLVMIGMTGVTVEPPVPRDKYEIRPATGVPLQFTDLNLKLAVIDELMYQQRVLEPKFSISEFVRWFDGRTIDLDDEGWQPIPEALDYFARLEIDQTAASAVRNLTVDAGNSIYQQIAPLWGGEDESFDIGSWEDVALFPNLESIQFISLEPDEASVQALRDRGIDVDL